MPIGGHIADPGMGMGREAASFSPSAADGWLFTTIGYGWLVRSLETTVNVFGKGSTILKTLN